MVSYIDPNQSVQVSLHVCARRIGGVINAVSDVNVSLLVCLIL